MPAAPPSKAIIALSIRCCRNSRARAAPSARRTADSRCLLTERDRRRFATLAQTMSSSTPTSSMRLHRASASRAFSASKPRRPGRVINSGILLASTVVPWGTSARSEESRNLCPGCGLRHSRFEPANLTNPPVAIVLDSRRVTGLTRLERHFRREWCVDVGPLTGPQSKIPGRGDADNPSRDSVDADGSIQGRGRSSEPAHPEAVTHHNDRLNAETILVVAERASEHRLNAEPLEVIAAHVLEADLFDRSLFQRQRHRIRIGGEADERARKPSAHAPDAGRGMRGSMTLASGLRQSFGTRRCDW